MSNYHMESEAAVEMLERRWFATYKSAEGMRSKCNALLAVVAAAETAWRLALTELAKIETLRDALGDQLSRIDDHVEPAPQVLRQSVKSAA
jgi:hypothetical protein